MTNLKIIALLGLLLSSLACANEHQDELSSSSPEQFEASLQRELSGAMDCCGLVCPPPPPPPPPPVYPDYGKATAMGGMGHHKDKGYTKEKGYKKGPKDNKKGSKDKGYPKKVKGYGRDLTETTQQDPRRLDNYYYYYQEQPYGYYNSPQQYAPYGCWLDCSACPPPGTWHRLYLNLFVTCVALLFESTLTNKPFDLPPFSLFVRRIR